MIAAQLQTREGKEALMLILEPANVERMSMGSPIVKDLHELHPALPEGIELIITYTPDLQYVHDEWRRTHDLAAAIDSSRQRKAVYRASVHDDDAVDAAI